MLHLPILTTERLQLRPLVLADAAQIHALAGHYDIYRVTSNVPHPYEEGMAERWIATHAHQFYTNQHVTLAVSNPTDGTIFGTVSLASHRSDKRAELGYWIGVPYWGNGYCTEAAQALIRYGIEVLGLHNSKKYTLVNWISFS